MIRSSVSLLALVAGLSMGATASAQSRTASQASTASPDDDFHGREYVVTAPGIEQLDVLAGTAVIEGLELQRNMDGQVGEILADLPGVSATSFSPGASRPVLRGLQGERVRVLTDGIGALDASNTSSDHAVSIDPLTADRIEVIRGPASLLYGSQAIGGAVNIISKRIPLRVPDEAVHVDAFAAGASAANLYEGGVSVDVPLADILALHVDGSYRNTDDLSVGGFTVGPELRAELLEEAAEEEAEEPEEADELREAAAQHGVLPNSFTETYSLGAGLTLAEGGNSLGFSVGYYDTKYGVPGRPGTGHAHSEEEGGEEEGEDGEEEGGEEEGEERVSIDLEQFRADMRAELALGTGVFESFKLRIGYSDYTHTEFEGEEVGTVFNVSGFEGRAELVQAELGGWRGALGGQFYYRDFEAIGAEAFVAPNETTQFGLFALQELPLGPLQLEGAARYERTDVNSKTLGVSRDFNALSGAIGLSYEIEGGLKFGVNGSRAERAPGGEELFANGPHIATQQFEIGDTTLDTEKSWGLEGYVRGDIGPARLSVAVYQNWFDDYIYLAETGGQEDDLPIFQYEQRDADYFGVEGEISVPFVERDGLTLLADVRGDYVRATLDDGSPLPRIPPLSLSGALEAQTTHFDIRGEVQWSDTQDRTAAFETRTDDFTMVNASVAWRPFGERNVTLLAQANNIFDVDARRHASFTKDFVPLAGRDFKLSARLSF
ncbi:MAG: TonB-dependent receptor [Pacificimonas sp.]